jgi:organic hydroperoxide reductase OsmC/OhrA
MTRVEIALRNIAGTEAALGWAGSHTLVVDRAEGRAGGRGLGFNGAELLALAIGGCLANDLRYVATDLGARIEAIAIDVALTLEGDPLLATAAEVRVSAEGPDPQAIAEAIARARAESTVANSIARGLSVSFVSA